MTDSQLIPPVHPPANLFAKPDCSPGDRGLRAGSIDPKQVESGDLHLMYCPQCDSSHWLAIPPHGVELPPSPLHLWE